MESQYMTRMQERAAACRRVPVTDLRVGDELISGHRVTAIQNGVVVALSSTVAAVHPKSKTTIRIRTSPDTTFMVVKP